MLRFTGDWQKLGAMIWFLKQSVTKKFAKSKKIEKDGRRRYSSLQSATKYFAKSKKIKQNSTSSVGTCKAIKAHSLYTKFQLPIYLLQINLAQKHSK